MTIKSFNKVIASDALRQTIPMHTLETNSRFGNFAWTATVEVTDEDLIHLANAGLLQILQRSPATNAEKVMAGYEKRPDNFKRSSIPYTPANEKQFAELMSQPIESEIKDEDGKVIHTLKFKPTVVAEFHEIGAAKELVYADEKKAVERHIKAGDALDWARDTVGYAGEGKIDTENVELLKAIRAFKLKLIADSL